MTGYRCQDSGKAFVRPPGRTQCPPDRVETIELSGRGTVYSWTTLHAAAEPFEKDLPFQIAIVELEEGARLTVRIEGERVKIGDPVRAVEERDGVWRFERAD